MDDPPPGKWRNLTLLALAECLAMALWFSASAVIPELTAEWSLGGAGRAWLTMSVQLGFVVGALASAALNLPDRVAGERLIAACALLGALFNAAITLPGTGFAAALALRFLTGVAMAGVYPPGMKLVASWTRADRGFAIGLLVGALTLGSAAPHLVNAFAAAGGSGSAAAVSLPSWRGVLLASSALATVAAALAALAVTTGPYVARASAFDWRLAHRALAHRPTRLANFGYLGHMWELYAMWTWTPLFLLEAYARADWSPLAARLAGFATIAVGAVGCVTAGLLADRLGRTAVAMVSLAVSGACCLTAGALFDSPALLTAVCLVWGFAVVADSAQFSAAVSELSDPRYVGTALTVQTSLGFLLTLVTIQLVPPLVSWLGWTRVFAVLALGPAFGIVSLWQLRQLPEAKCMASGHR